MIRCFQAQGISKLNITNKLAQEIVEIALKSKANSAYIDNGIVIKNIYKRIKPASSERIFELSAAPKSTVNEKHKVTIELLPTKEELKTDNPQYTTVFETVKTQENWHDQDSNQLPKEFAELLDRTFKGFWGKTGRRKLNLI